MGIQSKPLLQNRIRLLPRLLIAMGFQYATVLLLREIDAFPPYHSITNPHHRQPVRATAPAVSSTPSFGLGFICP